MSIIDQAKEAAISVADKASDKALGDDLIADLIVKYGSKKEHINEILEERGADYRISKMELEIGLPPKMIFSIEKV